jgi:Protein of unknown function (DUF1579)
MKSPKALMGLCVVASILSTPAMAQGPVAPTAEHKIFASEEGTWDATVKSFEGGPNAEPAVSKGTEVNTLLPGGLWLVSKFEGEFGGVKFEGRGQFGYDPNKKKYIGTWIDSMVPTLSVLEGEYDDKTKTMTYVGEGTGPDGKTKYMQRMVTTTKADGSRVFTLYMKVDKDEMKLVEISYTKRK